VLILTGISYSTWGSTYSEYLFGSNQWFTLTWEEKKEVFASIGADLLEIFEENCKEIRNWVFGSGTGVSTDSETLSRFRWNASEKWW
jgi:hypothetical protein